MPLPKTDPILKSLPPLDVYLSQIDLERVADAILGPPLESGRLAMADYDYAAAKELVWLAAETWLARDVLDLQISGIETEYIKTLPQTGTQKWKMILDLQGTLNGRLNVSKKYAGKRVVVDWKTTSGQLDKPWENRLLDSFQWKIYLYFENADVMVYRGLSREGKTRELWIERPANLEADLIPHLQGMMLQRQALIDAALPFWPRRMPSACGSYGRECPRLGDCRDGTMVRGIYPADKSLSYSSLDKFGLCPEKHRADLLSGEQDDTEASVFGSACHRGLANLYQQVKDKFCD